jgi:hypothetical protein
MNNFFYDLNKRMANLASKQDATQLAESKQAKTVAQSPLTQALNEGQAKRLPGLPITQKDVEKKFGGSMIKMAQAAKEAGFSDARIKQAMDDLKQGKNPNNIDEADYSAKKAAAGKDIGKPGKNFGKIAKGAAERYGSKAAGERVAGAQLAKMRAKESVEEAKLQPTPELMKKVRARLEQLHDEMEPEEAYEQMADELNITTRRLDQLLQDKRFFEADIEEGVIPFDADSNEPSPPFRWGQSHLRPALSKNKETKLIRDLRAQGLSDKQIVRKMEQIKRGTTKTVAKEGDMDESALQAYLGKKKYGETGMKALQQAGRDHAGKEKMAKIRAKYDKMDEGDMEEGNAFTGALAKTPKGGKFKVGSKEFTDTSDLEEGFADMDAWLASREKEKGTGRFDKRKISTGTVYTRKPETFDDPETDPEATGGAPKRRGRPKGKDKGPERVTAKSYKYKAGRPAKTQENLDSDGVMMTRPTNCSSESIEHGEQAEYNDEAGMTKDSLHTIVRNAKELERALRTNENLPEWVQEKIGQIKGMMTSVTDYIVSTHERDAEQHMEPVAEKSVSKAQRKFMGMAHAIQKGEKIKGASTELKKVAKTMKPSDTRDFAATKEKGLPKKVKKADEGKGDGNLANNAKPYDKVTQGDVVAGRLGKDEMGGKKKKEDKVDETTVAGSVAPAQNSAPKASKGMQFGKGVYEGYNKKFTQALTESISVQSKMAECGESMAPTLTIQADGEEAAKLMMLLKLAGLESQIPAACPTCNRAPCGCDQIVDENSPDWPTNTETLPAQPELRTYSGGLNGPKSTGQTTVPVVASQLRRQASMEESVKLEKSLFNTWKNYKG